MNFKSIVKKILLFLAAVLVIIQFIRPEKNISGNIDQDISKQYAVNTEVQAILKKACYDCHSNTTVYPWYAGIQPAAWWLADHVNEGKGELNFNAFLAYPLYRQFHKMEEVAEVLEEGEMPLSSYTLIHRNAILSEAEKNLLMQWSRNVRDTMTARYPADSLISPKKRAEAKEEQESESE